MRLNQKLKELRWASSVKLESNINALAQISK